MRTLELEWAHPLHDIHTEDHDGTVVIGDWRVTQGPPPEGFVLCEERCFRHGDAVCMADAGHEHPHICCIPKAFGGDVIVAVSRSRMVTA